MHPPPEARRRTPHPARTVLHPHPPVVPSHVLSDQREPEPAATAAAGPRSPRELFEEDECRLGGQLQRGPAVTSAAHDVADERSDGTTGPTGRKQAMLG